MANHTKKRIHHKIHHTHKKQSVKLIAFVVVGIVAIVVGLMAVTSEGNNFLFRSGAWDCAKYNFSVSQKGEVSVRNDSARPEPTTRVRVGINGVEVKSVDGKDLYAPALAPGQSAVLGMVPVPSNGTFTWRVVAVKDLRCDDQGEYKGVCKVGYLFTKKAISDGGANAGYLSENQVKAVVPANAEFVSFNLYKNALPAGALDDVDVLFVSDWSTSRIGYNPIEAELPSAAEVTAIGNAYKAGMSVVAVADNGKPTTDTQRVDAAASVIRIVNGIQNSFVYTTKIQNVYQSTYKTQTVWGPVVPWLEGLTINVSTSAVSTPGWVEAVSVNGVKPGSCLYQYRGYTSSTCGLSYLPKANGSGYLIIDSNAGGPTKTTGAMANMIAQACN